MRILIADDDPISRRQLEAVLVKWGYDVLITCDGAEAWQALRSEDAPQLAILDWMMPGMDGLELVHKVRGGSRDGYVYVILLTAKTARRDLVEGLSAGADDYVTKPFDRAELLARIRVGERVLELERSLTQRVSELEQALAHVGQLQGLLPICMFCKRVRDDHDYWQQVERYISERSQAMFTHSICPECYENHVRPELHSLKPTMRTERGAE